MSAWASIVKFSTSLLSIDDCCLDRLFYEELQYGWFPNLTCYSPSIRWNCVINVPLTSLSYLVTALEEAVVPNVTSSQSASCYRHCWRKHLSPCALHTSHILPSSSSDSVRAGHLLALTGQLRDARDWGSKAEIWINRQCKLVDNCSSLASSW